MFLFKKNHSFIFFRCTNLLSNAAALRLLLNMALKQKIGLPSLNTVILLGERVSTELLGSIQRVLHNAQRIAVILIKIKRNFF